MLSKLEINLRTKEIDNLPDEWVTLFLAKTPGIGKFLYVAVIGLREACPATANHSYRELGEIVRVIQFTAENVRVHNVTDGHINDFGGGSVWTETFYSGPAVIWTAVDECGRNQAFGERIKLEDVLAAR